MLKTASELLISRGRMLPLTFATAPVCLASEADSACPIPGFGKERTVMFAATRGGLAAGIWAGKGCSVLCRLVLEAI